ncbi:hypothetical protein IT407_02095 [Candidatus Uhrbacteria bacterium]|nr:hypothetical protein [Candidatus Uhrbacteria bacterium]
MRTLWLLFRSAIIAACLLLSFTARAHAQAAHPVIGEVAWAGSSLSSADEWLELWNTAANTTTLAGYKLRGASSADIVFGGSDEIPPYSAFLIANYGKDDEKSVLDVVPQIVTTTLSLSNSELKIELLGPDDSIADSAGDGGVPPAGTSLPEKMSMVRQTDGSWISAATSTPGVCDNCIIPEPVILIEESVTTSTEQIIETIPPASPTSTIPGPEPMLVATSATQETVELPIFSPELVQAPVSVIYIEPLDLKLHAIFPAPESGSEWIEIDASSATGTSHALNWSLRDGSSTIFRFQTSVLETIEERGSIWRIPLASARLNNGGDTVELVRPDGSIAERMTYPETDRGKTWIKNTDGNAWVIDPPPVQNESAVIVQMANPATIELPAIESADNVVPEPEAMPEPAAKPEETKKVKIEKTKPAPKSKTPSKPAPAVIQTSIETMHDISSGVKIKLSGMVATKPDIIGKHQFVLVAPDGHGLWVRASNKQPSPQQGTVVEVTGTLTQNDDGIYLKMSASDLWKAVDVPADVKPRIVDFLAYDEHDSWSFVEVTGTVLEVKGQNVEMDLNGVVAIARIKPATAYRATRLLKGDTLNVRGVVDLRGDMPIILPSSADNITLVAHAKKTDTEKPKTIPDWLPFGAAGITIAVTETVKRVRKIYREHQLRSRLALTDH